MHVHVHTCIGTRAVICRHTLQLVRVRACSCPPTPQAPRCCTHTQAHTHTCTHTRTHTHARTRAHTHTQRGLQKAALGAVWLSTAALLAAAAPALHLYRMILNTFLSSVLLSLAATANIMPSWEKVAQVQPQGPVASFLRCTLGTCRISITHILEAHTFSTADPRSKHGTCCGKAGTITMCGVGYQNSVARAHSPDTP